MAKTIIAPIGVPLVRLWTNAAISDTGTGSERSLWTGTLPANCLGPNGWIRWEGLYTTTNDASSKTLRVKIGGNIISTVGAANQLNQRFIGSIVNNSATGAQTAFTGNTNSVHNYNSGTATISTYTLDTTATLSVEVAHAMLAGDLAQLEYFLVWTCYMP